MLYYEGKNCIIIKLVNFYTLIPYNINNRGFDNFMIISKDNSKYKMWLKLSQKKYRQKEQLFLVEGEHLVFEAKKAGVLIDVLVCEGISFDIDAYITYLAKPLFEKLVSTVTSAGVMAVCRILESSIKKNNRLLLVDGIRDPGNLGTLIRSALAFGFDGLVLSEDTVDIYNEKVVRATQGAIFNLAISRRNLVDYIAILENLGVVVYATTLSDDAMVIDDVMPADCMAFIVGSEGAGIRESLVEASDGNVVIEMSSLVESLNVGVAGSILMHHFNGLRQVG